MGSVCVCVCVLGELLSGQDLNIIFIQKVMIGGLIVIFVQSLYIPYSNVTLEKDIIDNSRSHFLVSIHLVSYFDLIIKFVKKR